MTGVLERTSLSRFTAGWIYEVHESLARQLISLGGAKEVRNKRPALVITMDGDQDDKPMLSGGVIAIPRDRADARPAPKKKRQRKKGR